MAAALRSFVGLALRRASPESRLSSASSNTRVRMMHYDYSGRRYDAESSSRELVPAKPEDKYDGYFGFAATIGVALFAALMEGDFFGWHGTNNTRPRTTSRRGR